MVERMTRQFALALDLVDDAKLIAEYEEWHRPGPTPPPIIRSILESGIENMEIYRPGRDLDRNAPCFPSHRSLTTAKLHG